MNTSMEQYDEQTVFTTHLCERGLFTANPKVWIDWTNQLVTFPLWSVNGSMIGYQKYNWRAEKARANVGKYFTWVSEQYKPFGIWGMEYILSNDRFTTPLLVTEGIWDAVRAIEAGYRACAILTATPHRSLVRWFRLVTLNQKTVAIRDNDGENKCSHGLDKLTDIGYTVDGAKDIGELKIRQAQIWLSEKIK